MRALIISVAILTLGASQAQAQQGHSPQITDIPALGMQGWKYCAVVVDDVEVSIIRIDRGERASSYGTQERHCSSKLQKKYHKLKAAGAIVTTKPAREAENRHCDVTGSLMRSTGRNC